MSERRSTVQASEMRAYFTDYDQPTAPYEGRALRLTLVGGDLAVLTVGQLTEGDGKDVGVETFRFDDSKDSIGVDAEQLYETLGAMLRRDDRYAYDRLAEGTLQGDDPRLRTTVGAVHVPGVRRRA